MISAKVFSKYLLLTALLLLVFLPILSIFVNAFSHLNYPFLSKEWWGLFMQSAFGKREFIIFLRSVLISTLATVLSLIIGIPLAWLFERTNLTWKKILKLFSFAPIILPPYLIAISWIQLFTISGSFEKIGFSIYNLYFASAILGLSFFPIVMFIMSAALKRLNQRIVDAGKICANPLFVFKNIILPILSPSIILSGFFVFILSFTEFGVASILRTNSFISEIYVNFGAFYNYENSLLLLFPIYSVGFIFLIGYLWYQKQKKFENSPSFRNIEIKKLSKIQQIAGHIFIILILSFSIGIPITGLVIKTSPQAVVDVLKTTHQQIFSSVALATISSLAALSISLPIAHLIKQMAAKYQNIWLGISIFPMLIPSSIYGIAAIPLWNQGNLGWILGSGVILIIAYIVKTLPYGILSIYSALKNIPTKLEEAAQLAGSNLLQTYRKILIPLIKSAFVVTWFMMFVLIFRDLGMTLLLQPAGWQTLTSRIFTLYHYGAREEVAALSLLIISAHLILAYLVYKFTLSKRGIE